MPKENYWVHQEDPSPFHLAGNGDVGVLLLHGFAGTPREMSPLGQFLNQRGITVHAPLLPGHGTTVADMNLCTWHDWTLATQQAFGLLKQMCDRVFVAGFSMGSLLATWLAIQGVPIAGLVLYSPAIKVADWRIVLTPLLKHFAKSITKSKESDLKDPNAEQLLGGFERYPVPAAAELYKLQRYVRANQHKISSPACVIYSVHDRSIHPRSGQTTVKELSKVIPVETMVLYDSGHAVVVDKEWEKVAEETLLFIQRW